MAKQNQHWVVGQHACEAVLAKSVDRILEMYLVSRTQDRFSSFVNIAKTQGIAIQLVERDRLSQISGSARHQGIALRVKPKPLMREEQLRDQLVELVDRGEVPLLLVLDQVTDPHNYGAVLRCADATGVTAVVIGKDHAAPMTPVVHKVASGATETVDVCQVTNLGRFLDSLKKLGVWLVGTSDQAQQSIYQTDLTVPLALVMGAEGKGLRKLTENKCDMLMQLPMAGEVVSSLNISVATGVCLYEAIRQRTTH